MNDVRVRFAPSPTGHLHIGGARTAIYNWAFARHTGGTFVLRIDDTDPERSTPENTEAILRALRWLGLDWDEGPEVEGAYGPYFQTMRTASYLAALERLIASGDAYPCFCPPEDLEARRAAARAAAAAASGCPRTCRALTPEEAARRTASEPHVWRLKVPEDRGEIVFEDAVRGRLAFPGEAMDDFVLVRSDGTATYNLATVVDDAMMRITHVIRGDDHLSNTPRQMLVFEALGEPVPVYAHMSLILGTDGKRLSKRHGATSVEAYRDEGYLPEALLNHLALLGWSIDAETTVFSAEELVANFRLDRISRNPAIFDPGKLEWMNGVYIRALTPCELTDRMIPWLVDAGLITSEQAEERRGWLERVAPLVSERLKRMDEVVPTTAFLFGHGVRIDEAAAAKAFAEPAAALAVLDEVERRTAEVEPFDHGAVEAAYRAVPEQLGLKPRAVFQVVRVAVTGSLVSPPLFESVALLGREETLHRIGQARRRVAAEEA